MTHDPEAVRELRLVDRRVDATVRPTLQGIDTLPPREQARRRHWATGFRLFARLEAMRRVETMPRDEQTPDVSRLLSEHEAIAKSEQNDLRTFTRIMRQST